MVLDQGITPVTFSVGNTMKRVAVVGTSVMFFRCGGGGLCVGFVLWLFGLCLFVCLFVCAASATHTSFPARQLSCALLSLSDPPTRTRTQPTTNSNPVSALNWLGSGIAILGTYLYGLATDKAKADAAAAAGKPKAA